MSVRPPFSHAQSDLAHTFDQAYRSGHPIDPALRAEFCDTFKTSGQDQSLAAYARTVLLGPLED